MILPPGRLLDLVTAAFRAAGCPDEEAGRVASHLVDANLAGHDSHGVIRTAAYLQWLREGKVLAGQSVRVVFETDAITVLDGRFGFGQTVGGDVQFMALDPAISTAVRNRRWGDDVATVGADIHVWSDLAGAVAPVFAFRLTKNMLAPATRRQRRRRVRQFFKGKG